MEKWFSNRGQMVQVLCAVLAVVIGVVVNWQQLSTAIDLVQILRVLVFPAAVLLGFQLGKYIEGNAAKAPTFVPKQTVKYQFLTPTVKAGSYVDTESEQILGLSRVTVVSIDQVESGSESVPAALIEVAGTILYLSAGGRTKKLTSSRFLIPANPRLKSDDYSVFQFTCQKDSMTLTSISVDHINLPAQKVTFAICPMQYRAAS